MDGQSDSSLLSKIRTFFGLRQEPPVNDFRNPIWSSDDEDDEDELYTRQKIDVYTDPLDLHREFASQIHDVFKSFGSIFGDMRSLFHDERFDAGTNTLNADPEPENFFGNNIRDYYLKPGFDLNKRQESKEDIDLDGEISSKEISGLLKKSESDQNENPPTHPPFSGNLVPRRSFFQTIITTSITKPDGTVETRRIIKNGDDVVEETTTSSPNDPNTQLITNADPLSELMISGVIYQNIMKEFSSIFKNLH